VQREKKFHEKKPIAATKEKIDATNAFHWEIFAFNNAAL
jgi:hypothetical protein